MPADGLVCQNTGKLIIRQKRSIKIESIYMNASNEVTEFIYNQSERLAVHLS